MRHHFKALVVSVIEACNYQCMGCNASAPLLRQPKPRDIDGLVETLARIHSVADLDELFIEGGEPFLLPNLSSVVQRFIDACRPQKLFLINNGSILFKRPHLLSEFPTVKENRLRVSIHPELLFDYTVDEIVAHARNLAAANPAWLITLRADRKWTTALLRERQPKQSIPRCIARDVVQCVNVAPGYLGRCSPTRKEVLAANRFGISREARAAAEQDRLPVTDALTAESIQQWLAKPTACHYCTGDVAGDPGVPVFQHMPDDFQLPVDLAFRRALP